MGGMIMNITLYNNTSDKRYVNKALTHIATRRCQLKESTDILRPVVIVKKNNILLTANYCYIDTFKRYYYIEQSTMLADIIQLSLTVDVLMSHQLNIKNLNCLIKKNEYNYNPYYIDNGLLTRSDHQYTIDNIGVIGDDTLHYYIVTSGGNN